MARRRFFRRRSGGGVSIAKLAKAERRVMSLKNSSANVRRKLGDVMEQVLNAGVCGLAGFGFGFASAKNGGVMPSLGPVPADLSVAVVAHLLGILGVGGKMDTHFKALGNGGLTVFAMRQGARLGVGGTAPSTKGYAYEIEGYDDDAEGMSLQPGDFAGLEII